MVSPKMMVRSLIFWLAVFLIGQTCPVNAQNCDVSATDFDRKDLIESLKQGGFSGVINQKAIFNKTGAILVSGNCYEIYIYEYSFKPEGGIAIHFAQRLLIVSGNAYVGKYDVEDAPARIKGNVIEFNYDEEIGNKIIFEENGPPSKVYLNGETNYLDK